MGDLRWKSGERRKKKKERKRVKNGRVEEKLCEAHFKLRCHRLGAAFGRLGGGS